MIKGSNRIRRGGSWYSGDGSCTVSNRLLSNPNFRYKLMGFRIYIGGVL